MYFYDKLNTWFVRFLVVGIFQTFCVVFGCDTWSRCTGPREKSPSGCCKRLGGELCGDDIQEFCDVELGYTCVKGTCQGKNLFFHSYQLYIM